MEKYKGLWIREESMDKYVVDEVQGSYRLLAINEGDTVLDVGANIGAFSKLACEQGAKLVVGYEPFPENAKLAKKNAPKAHIVEAALISGKETEITFYVNVRGINHGSHSSVPTRGREMMSVKAENFAAVLKEVRPSKIKMDCEGAEYDLLLNKPLPSYVKRIALELHLQKRAHRESASTLHEQMLAQGFKCLKDPTPSFITKAWHVIGVYAR